MAQFKATCVRRLRVTVYGIILPFARGVGVEYDLVLLGLHNFLGWHMRCIVIRGGAWLVLLSPCNTMAQFKAKINDPSFLKCAVTWGPPGDALDLLSPASLLLYVCTRATWLGPTWGSPLLDFAYGMCGDATKYALAWSHCVAKLGGNTGVLDVRSQGITASANRAKGP